MTCLPGKTDKALGLVIDLDTCVGCQACVTACKGWNDQGYGVPLSDQNPYGSNPSGTFLNRVHSYQVQPAEAAPMIVNFPRSCLHCTDAPCVTVCPTGASYKRVEDGIVLVNEDACIGCGLCAWACPYGAREMDADAGVMKKCTLCVDRIYNENLPEEDREPACVRTCPTGARHFGDLSDPDSKVSQLVAARGGYDLMPEQGTKPVNKYLPPRKKDRPDQASLLAPLLDIQATGFAGWLDRVLRKI
ncbi:4Fe-4S dicluster domain-containing protein [Pseudotabrizicola alkalilacus]|uniref:4Fe-4S dicluster domain-containing protein n=1 Tax=Pseudotabrizicola alkalilacus TaxID=2305252 RepID=A0A411Z2F4_9RHOB|nr:4Fe-4S dicluster domain-containing protein [Pseudotabrizicola alkalilacus]RGP37247.1 4Fe-4S dicluster domain-containing protein [Pseudotabrizicola alkalilacus]